MGQGEGGTSFRPVNPPFCALRKLDVLGNPIIGAEFRNLNQDPEGITGVDE
jgi:hypothetical protein